MLVEGVRNGFCGEAACPATNSREAGVVVAARLHLSDRQNWGLLALTEAEAEVSYGKSQATATERQATMQWQRLEARATETEMPWGLSATTRKAEQRAFLW